jgi:hypothetical protein
VGCGACRSGEAEECTLRDELTPALEATASATALLLSAPIYYGYPSGLFKSYLDRWYSFRSGDRKLRVPQPRPALLILTQGHGEADAYGWTRQSLERVLGSYGLEPSLFVAPGLEQCGDVGDRPELLHEARSLGRKLAP